MQPISEGTRYAGVYQHIYLINKFNFNLLINVPTVGTFWKRPILCINAPLILLFIFATTGSLNWPPRHSILWDVETSVKTPRLSLVLQLSFSRDALQSTEMPLDLRAYFLIFEESSASVRPSIQDGDSLSIILFQAIPRVAWKADFLQYEGRDV